MALPSIPGLKLPRVFQTEPVFHGSMSPETLEGLAGVAFGSYDNEKADLIQPSILVKTNGDCGIPKRFDGAGVDFKPLAAFLKELYEIVGQVLPNDALFAADFDPVPPGHRQRQGVHRDLRRGFFVSSALPTTFPNAARTQGDPYQIVETGPLTLHESTVNTTGAEVPRMFATIQTFRKPLVGNILGR